MINKENLWFITLFSLILVLGVYYVTMADDTLKFENVVDESEAVISVTESNVLTALKVANDEEILKETAMYEDIILDSSSTTVEKSEAYESLQMLKENINTTETIKTLIRDKFKLDSFIKIENDIINITISSCEHNQTIANNIINEVQKLYKNQMYITVKFA